MMPSFRELVKSLIQFLKEKLPETNILFGEYGKIPQETPAILIYAEPFSFKKDSLAKRNIRYAKITIFALAGGYEQNADSVFESVEMIDKIENLIRQFEINFGLQFMASDEPIGFDAIYNNIAVSFVEFISPYKLSN